MMGGGGPLGTAMSGGDAGAVMGGGDVSSAAVLGIGGLTGSATSLALPNLKLQHHCEGLHRFGV